MNQIKTTLKNIPIIITYETIDSFRKIYNITSTKVDTQSRAVLDFTHILTQADKEKIYRLIRAKKTL